MAKGSATWRRVKFAQITQCVNDRVDDPKSAGVDRYVGLEHLDPESLAIRRWGTPDDVESTKLRFKPGDIIFGKRRAYQRKLGVADFEGICSAHAMVLRARPDAVVPEFLPFFMQSDLFMERAIAISVGSLSPTINWKTLAAEEFALPPLEEQRRLTNVLRATSRLQDESGRLQRALTATRRSLLVDIFRPDRGSRDRFPEHWKVMRAAAAGHCQLGQQRHPMFDAGDNVRPYLRVANVFDGNIDLSDVLSMHFPTSALGKFELQPGDILLNEGQSTELVGRSAIWLGEVPGMCFQKTLLRFRCGPLLVPEFAHAFFQHMLYTGQFARVAVQTTSIAHLTSVRFAELLLPVPPLAEQRLLVERFAALSGAEVSATRRAAHAAQTARQILNSMVAR